jgi:hypothetical protein
VVGQELQGRRDGVTASGRAEVQSMW